jgi:hypothetical protein
MKLILSKVLVASLLVAQEVGARGIRANNQENNPRNLNDEDEASWTRFVLEHTSLRKFIVEPHQMH